MAWAELNFHQIFKTKKVVYYMFDQLPRWKFMLIRVYLSIDIVSMPMGLSLVFEFIEIIVEHIPFELADRGLIW